MLNVWGGHGLLKRGHFYTNPETGRTHFISDGKGGPELAQIARKDYVRKHPYPVHINRFNPLPREKATIIKLRNFGYPIQHIAKGLGRSTSFIQRILKQARIMGALKDAVYDMRKCSRTTRLMLTRKKLYSLLNWLPLWEGFILGSEENPP